MPKTSKDGGKTTLSPPHLEGVSGKAQTYPELRGVFPPLRVAIYARVSTKDQDASRQVRELLELAEHRGYEVVILGVETLSGRSRRLPERERVMELARTGRIKAVLCSELTRWGRSLVDVVQTLEQLQGWGVSFLTLRGLEINMGTAEGRMLAGIMATLAQFEAELIRERVLSGLANARSKGKRLGRPKGHSAKVRRVQTQIIELAHMGYTPTEIRRNLVETRGVVVSRSTIRQVVADWRQSYLWAPEG